jgi:hypothetical protein
VVAVLLLIGALRDLSQLDAPVYHEQVTGEVVMSAAFNRFAVVTPDEPWAVFLVWVVD